MVKKLKIDVELCSGCKLCKSVCIRDNIEIDETAYELESNCFDCGHCMAVCPEGAITLVKYENQMDMVEEYNARQIPVDYDDLLQFLKQRRSIRWFKNKKVDKDTFDKLFKEFMNLVYDIIKVQENEFFRIKEFGDYLKDKSSKEFHPLLWEGTQLILTFATDKTSAVIANTRLELLAYSLGLGGFYSLFILKADEIGHDKLMEFFPNIDNDKHMYSAFIIGYPKKRFRRTVPHDEINITFM